MYSILNLKKQQQTNKQKKPSLFGLNSIEIQVKFTGKNSLVQLAFDTKLHDHIV